MKNAIIRVRIAEVNDYSACLPLFAVLYHGDIGQDFKHVFEEYVQGKEGVILLAYKLNMLLGILVGSFQLDIDWEGRTARIEAIIVDKTHRMKGIGKKLTEHFIAMANRRNCKAVKSRVNTNNTAAQKFHQQLGFAKANTYEYIMDFPETA